MPTTDDITDDYVTEMLKRDAKAASASASARSLGQLLNNKRPTSSAPKPNTRFLRNILRDTDSHNAALLAKEAEESKVRLKQLRQSGRPEQQFYSARDRHDGKRRRLEPADQPSTEPSKRRRQRSPSPSGHRRHRHSPDRRDRDKASSRRRSRSPAPDSSRHRHDRHRSSHSHHHDDSRKRSRPSHRSASPSRHHTKSNDRAEPSGPSSRSRKRKQSSASEASDSDPLDAIVGPAPAPANPPLRSRGRGTLNRSSAIDDHFASNYDPTVDVQPESRQDDELDWDSALEALRDRQKWRQQGADRLRAAGFSKTDVAKWEKGGEKSEEDVVWSKKGEGREWDRGKVLDDDGLVNVKPEWGRLKNS